MTSILEHAFREASKLPEHEQEALAAVIMAELESEQRWNRALSGSADILSALGDEAQAENRNGKTLPLDPDRL